MKSYIKTNLKTENARKSTIERRYINENWRQPHFFKNIATSDLNSNICMIMFQQNN